MNDPEQAKGFDAGAGEGSPGPRRRRRLHSRELFLGARELVIEHAGEDYRLAVTRKGRLILTK